MKSIAFPLLVALLALPALSQTVVDGGFEEGGSAWTVIDTPGGAGAPGDLREYDVDGPGRSADPKRCT